MNNLALKTLSLRDLLIDILAFALVYMLPAASHLTGIPLYMIEPMRLALVLALIWGSPFNAYLLALTLPVFSLVVSGHPAFIKMLIITGELVFNVFLYRLFFSRGIYPFAAMFLAILFSKIACYLAYWPVFGMNFVIEEGNPSFLAIQLLTTILFSIFVALNMKKKST